MKLNPQQAPLYGDCVITVFLTEDDKVENEDVAFYLVFTGSAVQHCTSTKKLDSTTLETIAPGHDCCETVKVSLCATKQGRPVLVVAEDSFQFVQDEAYDAAQFLATCAGNQQALNFTRFLDRSRPPAGDVDFLDEKVALAFRHLKLPAGWNVLGADHMLNEHIPRETLMHFAVRLGLLRLTWFLLQQPGGRGALDVPNSEGATPVSLALERGYQKLHQLLTEERAGEPDSWSTLSHTVHSSEYCVKYHRGRNVYTLTVETKEGTRPNLENDISRLQTHIQSHQCTSASEHPPSEQRAACDQNSRPDSGPATANHNLEETMAEGSRGDLSTLLDPATIPILAPVCPEEDACRRLQEPLDALKESSNPKNGENPTSSGKNRKVAGRHKEEEEELPSTVDCGVVLEENDRRLSSLAGLQSPSSLPSCGEQNKEAGMTSPKVALEQGSVCEREDSRQEVQTADEREAASASKPLTSCQACGAGMGQTECKSCTGSVEVVVASAAQLCPESGGGDEGLPGVMVVAPVQMDPGDASGSPTSEGRGGISEQAAVVLLSDVGAELNQKAGTAAHVGSAQDSFAKRSEDGGLLGEDGQSVASCPPTEPAAVGTAHVLESLPMCGPVLEGAETKVAVGANSLDLDGQGPVADASAVDDGFGQRFAEPEASGTRDEVKETAAEVQDQHKTFEPEFSGTETASHSSGGRTDASCLAQEPGAGCHVKGRGPGEKEQCSCSGSHAASGDGPKPPPGSLDPVGSSSAREEPLCKRGETAGNSHELDRFCRSAQEFIAVASALLVEEAIQQAQLIVAQQSSTGAAPVGQEASPQLEDLARASCGKGTERVQDNWMGTPSPAHSAESKQNQEVAEGAAALLVVAEDHDERTAERLFPVDHPGQKSGNSSSLQLSGNGQELAGKDEALSKGLTSAAVVQSPPCSWGVELPVSDNHAQVGFKGEASSPEVGETVATTAGVLQEPRLPDDASLQAAKAPCPAAMLNQELELCLDSHAVPPSIRVSGLMEAPLADCEVPPVASLPREGEEVDSVPSRTLLQPIAEEPPCDCDSGSEGLFSACEGDTWSDAKATHREVLAQPDDGQREGRRTEPESPPLPPCIAVEASASVQATDGILPDHVGKAEKSPSQATLEVGMLVPLAPLFANPTDTLPVTESRSEAQPVSDPSPVLNREKDTSLEPDGLMETESPGAAAPTPVADALEMKKEEEVDALGGLVADSTSSERSINRESWSSVEPSPSPLESKRPCSFAEGDTFLEDGLSGDCTSSQDILKRGSGSESDLFPLPGDGMDDMDFGKQPEEEQSVGDSTSSSSSADDTLSLERNSSLGSDISLPQALGLSRPKDRYSLDGTCFNLGSTESQDGEAAISGELEEELDSITEVPPPSSVLRNSMRPLSPFRRHSWGPGKNASSEAEINHRSSMRMLGDGIRKPPTHRRSLSWCPSGVQCMAMGADLNGRSYSLEGLAGETDNTKTTSSGLNSASLNTKDLQQSPLANDERGSLVSLTEEELESEQGEARGLDRQMRQRSQPRAFSFCATPVSPPLTKSMSLMTVTEPGPDSGRSFTSTTSSLTQSICEESCHFLPPSPSRKDLEGKSGTKVSRTFSYLKNKMSSSKKSKEKDKDKEKAKEKERDSREREKDKKTISGHLFSATPTVGPVTCYHCLKPFNKDSYACPTCGIIVHKSCKENVTACAKVKMKLQKGGLQPHDTSSLPTVIMRNKNSQTRERPRSAILAPDEIAVPSLFNNRRSQQNPALSKSVSIQNIAGVGNDESVLHTWKFLSQSTDSLNKISRVNESTESLTDEGADMNEGQLMGDFEMDSKQLEAQSWSQVVDSKFLRQQKKDVVKRQDVIYELMQTEMHHVRTLKIMSDVYSRGMMEELQYEQQMVEKVFPCLDDLLNIHSQFFQRILERKKESLADRSEKNFVIRRIGDILVNQFSGENAERMKKTYGKFCGHHNEAVNYFKDLLSKEKRFQAFIKKKMSSSVVRRLGIPECILLVTQRITKYPVLLQRILQHTKENDDEHQDLVLSLNQVKEVITAVNSKVSNYEKKMRLHEIYTRTDSKSIMRMKSGQMFAREDLRRRKFVRDGPVSLKNAAGRLKEVQAVLLSDVLIFLQEKDQKYVFASLDQKSTVISLKKLIVREVAHEEKGLFLISMGGKDPEMVEVHASTKEERNSWIQTIQDTINMMDKEEDEGIPSESEEEKRVLDSKARELKEQLQQKDQQIITLLEEKEKIFRDMTDCSGPEDNLAARPLFRANTDEAPKGESVMKSVINEVELLQGLVSRSLGSALGQQMCTLALEQEAVGPVSLPRRAETFGGFDSHQMSVCKGGEREEGDDAQDLRRTESDSVLKKGGTTNLMFVLKRNNEQVLQSITHLHSLLGTLQAIVVQQDTYIEDQKLLLIERTLSRSSFRPNSLIEQEKQRSLEKQRQELANLQKQQTQLQEEKRRKEREWEAREKELAEREARLARREEQAQKGLQGLEKEREELLQKKASYQLDLEQLRAAQKQLEKEKELLKREVEQMPQPQAELSNKHGKVGRTPSLPVPEDSSSRPKQGHLDTELSLSPKRNSLSRTHKEKSTFHLLGMTTSNQTNKAAEGHSQIPNRLFGLAKPKEKKEKKKKGKGHRSQPADAHSPEAAPEGEEIFC